MVRRRRIYRRRVYRRTGGGLTEETQRPPRPTQPPTIVRSGPCKTRSGPVRQSYIDYIKRFPAEKQAYMCAVSGVSPKLLKESSTAGMYSRRRRRTTRRRY